MSKAKIFQILLPFLLIVVFIISCVGTGRIFSPFWAEYNFVPIDNSIKSYKEVLVFTPNNVEIVECEYLDDYLKTHTQYSFLMPKEQDEFYRLKLIENTKDWKNHPTFKVQKLSENRQLIELTEYFSTSNSIIRYEATDKEFFFKAYKIETLVTEFPFLLFAVSFGFLSAILIRVILKKFVISRIK